MKTLEQAEQHVNELCLNPSVSGTEGTGTITVFGQIATKLRANGINVFAIYAVSKYAIELITEYGDQISTKIDEIVDHITDILKK